MANNSETFKLSLIRGSLKGYYIKLIYKPGTKYLKGLITMGEHYGLVQVKNKSEASEFEVVWIDDNHVKLIDNKANYYLTLNDRSFLQDYDRNQLFTYCKVSKTFESAYEKYSMFGIFGNNIVTFKRESID